MAIKRYRQLGINNRTDKLQDRIIQHREIPPLFCNINSFKWSDLHADLQRCTLQLSFPGGSAIRNLPARQETWIQSLGWADPLEEGMATHSNTPFGELRGQRSLAGPSPWVGKGSDTTSNHAAARPKLVFPLCLSKEQRMPMQKPPHLMYHVLPSHVTAFDLVLWDLQLGCPRVTSTRRQRLALCARSDHK